MRTFLYALIFTTTSLQAQNSLVFDTRFVESEDRWVAFQMDKDSLYPYGFIYIDAQAGLTLNYAGSFRIAENGEFIPKKTDSTNVKVRLQANNVKVAFIPESKFSELQVEAVPGWLKFYKTDTGSVARLHRWGYLYNGWGECTKALTYLERAEKIDPKFKGLQVELAFSYNCLGEYDKAIVVLKDALEANPSDAYTNKEMIYAQMKAGQMEKAAESCKKALEVCTDTRYHSESCYNILYNFYKAKDKKNFLLWLDETKKWTAGNEQLKNSIKIMEDEMAR